MTPKQQNDDRLAEAMQYARDNGNVMRRNSRRHEVYANVVARCRNPKHPSWRWYGGKGVKCKMSLAQFDRLWERDKAYLLKRPSIDRIDSNGHYEVSNCRFIELSENVRRAHLGKKKRRATIDSAASSPMSDAREGLTEPDTKTAVLTSADKGAEASTETAL
jgi:hypothetical protein